MKKIQREVEYQTEDGRTFTKANAAKFWDTVSKAKLAYESAKEKLGEVLATSFKTADGIPFTFAENYYYVFEPFNAAPTILEVRFWWRHWGFDAERDSDTQMVIYSFQDGWGHDRTKDPVAYPVNELYAYRSNAEAAMIAAKERYAANIMEDVAKWKEKQRPQ